MGWGLPLFEISQGIPILRYQKTSKMAVSFSFSAYFPNTEILETRINPRFFALVLGQGFIFVQPSQISTMVLIRNHRAFSIMVAIITVI